MSAGASARRRRSSGAVNATWRGSSCFGDVFGKGFAKGPAAGLAAPEPGARYGRQKKGKDIEIN